VPSNWTTVGDAITTRLNEIGMQQKDLAATSSVSVATIREIQGGKERRRSPRILQGISVALEWPADYLADLLQGKKPEQQSQETRESEAPAVQPDPSDFLNKLAFILEHRIGARR
jgi:hypothetical protein